MKFDDINHLNLVLHRFMTKLIDTYGQSKQKILLPASKILEKRNRFAANIETKLAVPSLQTFLLTLGQ